MMPRAIVFDAYGTLFDVRAVVLREAHRIDADRDGLARLWRQRQLEHTWLLSLMGRYEDFWSVTQSALHAACRQLRVELSRSQLDVLLTSYLSAPLFPEVTLALERLKGFPLAILSNGSPAMLDAAVHSQRAELDSDRSHFRRSSENLQALAAGLRPRCGNPRPRCGRYAFCILQLVGRLGSQNLWLQRLLV